MDPAGAASAARTARPWADGSWLARMFVYPKEGLWARP
jgi:hypothetical protein